MSDWGVRGEGTSEGPSEDRILELRPEGQEKAGGGGEGIFCALWGRGD